MRIAGVTTENNGGFSTMMNSRTLFWIVWALGSLGQGFAFLFAQVPAADAIILGTSMILATVLLAAAVRIGVRAWKAPTSRDSGGEESQTLTPIEGLVTLMAGVQLLVSCMWILGVVIDGLHR